ncbi:MAG: hypothetical protein HYT76_02455 [Deltaproteobacteria bacterium]|nr:hypothetical protein [Deltaproteobacteria bacterium]
MSRIDQIDSALNHLGEIKRVATAYVVRAEVAAREFRVAFEGNKRFMPPIHDGDIVPCYEQVGLIVERYKELKGLLYGRDRHAGTLGLQLLRLDRLASAVHAEDVPNVVYHIQQEIGCIPSRQAVGEWGMRLVTHSDVVKDQIPLVDRLLLHLLERRREIRFQNRLSIGIGIVAVALFGGLYSVATYQ